jgi:hypothetical protein
LLVVAACVLSAVIASHWGLRVAVPENHHEDLWIYTAACDLAWHGTSPYDTELIHRKVAEQFPNDPDFIENSGFMYPPAALLAFAPLTLLPWTSAKAAWCVAAVLAGVATGLTLGRFSRTALPGWFAGAAVAATLLNPLSMFTLVVGQTPLLFVGCVAVGQWAHTAGWKRLGGLLWGLAFVKPHIALPLLLLAYLLNGWKRAAEVCVWAAVLNVLAGVLTVGNPLFVLDYLKYIQHGHQSVEFNRVSVNPQITGWNRLVVAAGGPAVELGMAGTVAGYVVFFAMAAWRGRAAERSVAWLTAVAACGMLFCCQLLPYELPLLVLVLPYLGELLTTGRRRDAVAAALILGAGAFAMLPGGEASDYYRTIRGLFGPFDDLVRLNTGFPLNVTDVLLSHRALGVLGVVVGVVGYGPPAAGHFFRDRRAGASASASVASVG